jgi:uncharacterized protein (DUF2267 family)
MASTGAGVFGHAVHTAEIWVADTANALGTDDHHYAYRLLRAWLHALRDRLTVHSAAKFGAQLPELLRGVYYEGWQPSRVPDKYHPDGYAHRFAAEAKVSVVDAPGLAAAIADALARHMSPGQVAGVAAQLPSALRESVTGNHRTRDDAPDGPPTASGVAPEKLLADLEDRVDNLTAAVRALALGIEQAPGAGIDESRRTRAARLAADILIAGSATRSGEPALAAEPPGAE